MQTIDIQSNGGGYGIVTFSITNGKSFKSVICSMLNAQQVEKKMITLKEKRCLLHLVA